jgi:phenylalanyl-tRNA synthetase beta chain
MRVSYKWLKELVNIENLTPQVLVHDLSLHSTEVETLSQISNATGVVVGYVESCVAHPNSDHLHVCMVNIGTDTLQIVCGAPNVAAGQKVMVSLPGAVLPGDVSIKKSVIRGVESSGMICSLKEIGIENKYIPEAYQNGIYVLDPDAP